MGIAAAAHLALLLAFLRTRLDVPTPQDQATVWATMLPSRPSPVPTPSLPLPRPLDRPAPRPLVAPVPLVPMPMPPAAALIAAAPASAASAPLPKDAASAPLRLTLTPAQLRALEADTPRTLAQRLAPPPPASPLAQRLAPTQEFEEDDRGGMHTVRSHGGCFILVPSGAAKVDPFNHGGERLTGRSTNDNC